MRCAGRSCASPTSHRRAAGRHRTTSRSWASSGADPSWRQRIADGHPRSRAGRRAGRRPGCRRPTATTAAGAIDADAAAVIPNARLRAYDPARTTVVLVDDVLFTGSHGAGRARRPDGPRPAGRGAPRRAHRPRPSRAAHPRRLRGPQRAHGARRAGRAPPGRRWMADEERRLPASAQDDADAGSAQRWLLVARQLDLCPAAVLEARRAVSAASRASRRTHCAGALPGMTQRTARSNPWWCRSRTTWPRRL